MVRYVLEHIEEREYWAYTVVEAILTTQYKIFGLVLWVNKVEVYKNSSFWKYSDTGVYTTDKIDKILNLLYTDSKNPRPCIGGE